MSGRKWTVLLVLLGGALGAGCHSECTEDDELDTGELLACEVVFGAVDVVGAGIEAAFDAIDDAIERSANDAPGPPPLVGAGLIAFDLLDGASYVLSDDLTAGPALLDPRAAAWDASADRAFVWDRSRRAIVEVDPLRGSRHVRAWDTAYLDLRAMVVADGALVAVDAHGVVRIDLSLGPTAAVEALTAPGEFTNATALAFDPAGDRYLVGEEDAVWAVDAQTGARTLFSSVDQGASARDRGGATVAALAFDPWRDALYLYDTEGNLFRVDPSTGDRTHLADLAGAAGLAVTPYELLLARNATLLSHDPASPSRLGGWKPVGGDGPRPRRPVAVLYDPLRDRALVLDAG